MSYLVFARKYRPQRFEDVVGQNHITRTLRNAIRNDRVGSGYLFCGPRGTGKTTTARLLAKALNCTEGPTPEPCGACPTCIEIAAGSSLDVLEIDAASNTGVDDVRTLRENVRYLPTSGNKRIYIIDEVHRLSGAAFDALLKTLEEPPAHVMFVFATTEPLKVPETILSRTQRFDFKRVSVADMAGNLDKSAKAEDLQIDEAALTILARKADGSVRDSLSLMDQVAAFASGQVGEQEVIDALGLVDRRFLTEFTDAVAVGNTAEVLTLTVRLTDGGVDVEDFVTELLEHLRVLLLLTTDKNAGGTMGFTDQELSEYLAQAATFTVGDVIRLMKISTDLKVDLRSGLDERLALQMAAVKMAQLESTVRLEEILAHLEQGGGNLSPPSSVKKKSDVAKPAPQSAATTTIRRKPETSSPTPKAADSPTSPQPEIDPTPSGVTLTLEQVAQGWEGFLSLLKTRRPLVASTLSLMQIKVLEEGVMTLAMDHSAVASRPMLEKPETLNLIQVAFADHYGAGVRIRYTIDALGNGMTSSADRVKVQREKIETAVANSDRLKMLIEKVDGEVVGVRKVQE